jgi:hypothetical protein
LAALAGAWISACVLAAGAALAEQPKSPGSSPGSTTASSASSASSELSADTLFEQGKAAGKRKDWNEAYRLFRLAWQKKQTYDIAGNLGQVALLLGRPAEAAQLVTTSLATFPPSAGRSQRARMEELLRVATSRAATFHLDVRPAHARVVVDGTDLGPYHELSPTLFLDPGAHVIEARLDGYTPDRRSLAAEAGTSSELVIELRPASPRPASPRPASSLTPAPARQASAPAPAPARETSAPPPAPARQASTPPPAPARQASAPPPARGSGLAPASGTLARDPTADSASRPLRPHADPHADPHAGFHAGHAALLVGGTATLAAAGGTVFYSLRASNDERAAERQLSALRLDSGLQNPCAGSGASSAACVELSETVARRDEASRTSLALTEIRPVFTAEGASIFLNGSF